MSELSQSTTRTSEERVIDDAIDKIEQTLPLLKYMAEAETTGASGHADTPNPSRRLSAAQFRHAQEVFAGMREDPLLNEAGTDICVCSKDKKRRRRMGKHKKSSPSTKQCPDCG